MPSWLVGDAAQLGEVAGKALLMYLVAIIGLRFSERRTLAQWRLIDFATAVAMGAIIGRTIVADSQSFVTGAVALVVLVALHRLVSVLRFLEPVALTLDHRVRVLLVNGKFCRSQMRRCGLTDDDVYSQLRQQDVQRLDELRYVLYEPAGELTLVRKDDPPVADADVVANAFSHALGTPPSAATPPPADREAPGRAPT